MSERITLLSYADDRAGSKGGRYRETQRLMHEMLTGHPEICRMLSYTDDDLISTDFYTQNKKLLNPSIFNLLERFSNEL